MPPAPRRRTISNWAISLGGRRRGRGLGHREPGRRPSSLHSIAPRRPSWATPPNNRPAPTASGTLAKTPLVHLLLYALDKKLTGTHRALRAGQAQRGHPLRRRASRSKVRTSEPVAYLGQVLRELGYIDERELSRSLAELAKREGGRAKLHGPCCSRRTPSTRAKLRAGLAEQIGRKLRHVAAMPRRHGVRLLRRLRRAARLGRGRRCAGSTPSRISGACSASTPRGSTCNAALARSATSPLRLARGADVARLRLAKEEAAARRAPARAPAARGGAREGGRRSTSGPRSSSRTCCSSPSRSTCSRHVEVACRPPSRSRIALAVASRRDGQRGRRPRRRRRRLPAADARRQSSARRLRLRPGLSPELAERWQEIIDRAATIDRADYFMMLDVARDATPRGRRDGLLRARQALAPRPPARRARARARRLLARLRAHERGAHDAGRRRAARPLHEAPRRRQRLARDAGRRSRRSSRRRTNFQKAEVCFKRNDLAQAEVYCRKALEADATQPDYLAMLAWLVALKPENQSPEKTLESIKMLDRAASMSNGRCEKALLLARHALQAPRQDRPGDEGLQARRRPEPAQHRRRARGAPLQHARRTAAALPPRPSRAARCRPEPEDAQKGGLFGRLFKKP